MSPSKVLKGYGYISLTINLFNPDTTKYHIKRYITTNTFKAMLDKFWQNQDMYYIILGHNFTDRKS